MLKHLRRLTLKTIKEDLFDSSVYEGIKEWREFDIDEMIQDDWSKLLISIKGIDLLKNRKSRKIINDTLMPNEIHELKIIYNDLSLNNNEVCKKIEKEQWKNSNIMKKYISFFGYDEEYLNSSLDLLPNITVENKTNFYELLDYQYVIRQKILYQLKRDKKLNKMIVQMPTGTGKTKTALHTIINYYSNDLKGNGLILWLAHTSVLVEQALSTFFNLWPILGKHPAKIYRMYDKFGFDEDSNAFVFGTFDKLISIKKNNKEIFDFIKNKVSLIIVDEVHRAVAPKMKNCLNEMMKLYGGNDRKLIGLTATVGRSNVDVDENQKIVEMFEGNIIKIDINLLNYINYPEKMSGIMNNSDKDVIKYLQSRKILSILERKELEYQCFMTENELEQLKEELSRGKSHAEDLSKSMVQKLALNRKRNEAIIREIIELSKKEIPTIVFACSVTHAKLLSSILLAKNVKNSLVYGDQGYVEQNKEIEKFKNRDNDTNVIINYEVLTTGFDSTNIGCVFITRPTKSIVLYSQMIGRGLRGSQMGGNESCLLIDVKDNLSDYANESEAFNYFDAYWK